MLGDVTNLWQPSDGNVLARASDGFVVTVRDTDWARFAPANLGDDRLAYGLRVDPIEKCSTLTVVVAQRGKPT